MPDFPPRLRKAGAAATVAKEASIVGKEASIVGEEGGFLVKVAEEGGSLLGGTAGTTMATGENGFTLEELRPGRFHERARQDCRRGPRS